MYHTLNTIDFSDLLTRVRIGWMIRVAWGWERPKLCTGRRWAGLIWNIRYWWASVERAIRLANILMSVCSSNVVRKMGENLRGTIAVILYHTFIRWRCLSYNSIIQSHPAVPDGQNRELAARDNEKSGRLIQYAILLWLKWTSRHSLLQMIYQTQGTPQESRTLPYSCFSAKICLPRSVLLTGKILPILPVRISAVLLYLSCVESKWRSS